jgi:8-oxo-dGTP pyrophosphatase MutT (NUDIX family)
MLSNEPRPASTVVVLRPSREGPFELLLLRRNDSVAFMGGAYVFPGGRVDPADHTRPTSARYLTGPARFPGLTTEQEWPYRVAAVRELAEEAAISISEDDLVPLAHWVTPQVETRRYDTTFFVTRMPPGQEAKHDDSETVDLVWLTPGQAVDRARVGAIQVPPPTWTTIRQLQAHRSIDDVFEWAERRRIVTVMPGFVKNAGVTMLTLPGDPLFPAIDGWEIPDETRFVLTADRRWQPTRP